MKEEPTIAALKKFRQSVSALQTRATHYHENVVEMQKIVKYVKADLDALIDACNNEK